MTGARVISADSHVQELPELYSERLEARCRDRAPHFEERDGARYFVVDGKKPRRVDLAAEREEDDDRNREFRSDPTGGRDIARRLKDQARDGISAEVIYPNSSLFLYNSRDPGYQLAVARAYNDWGIELFGSHADRFVPVAIVPVIDLDEAVHAKNHHKATRAPISRALDRSQYGSKNNPAPSIERSEALQSRTNINRGTTRGGNNGGRGDAGGLGM